MGHHAAQASHAETNWFQATRDRLRNRPESRDAHRDTVPTAHIDTKTFDGDDLCPRGRVPQPHKKKKINWFQATLILIAETVSLGILSLPASMADMGLVAGTLVILAFGLITLSTGFMLYHFRQRYPHVHGFGDAGYVVAGPTGAVVAESLFQILLVFVAAAHILTFSVMARTVAGDGWKCTVVFKAVGFVVCVVCSLPRTFHSNSYLSGLSCVSILTATLIAMIDIAIEGEGLGTAVIAGRVDVVTADWMMSLSNILVSFTGHLAYFQVMAEMEQPRDFRKSLIATNAFMSSLYLVVSIVIYDFAGTAVGSPALSAASPLFAKIAYGIATPTIVVAGVIAGLLACKRIHDWFWRLYRREPNVVDESSCRAWSSWLGIVLTVYGLAFVLANVIPYFSPLLALIGAISATWICLGFPAMYCMYMCHHGFGATVPEVDGKGDDVTRWKSRQLMAGERDSPWWRTFTFPQSAGRPTQLLWVASVLIFVLAWLMVGFGAYGSIKSMITQSIAGYSPFSCKADP
ncbi:N amino acid transport system protein [Teratosphaeria destructans]|uniref:N amino acid transport system protein n=1 Tax=Teratosphaeria destructans TaxID=418781 RepID=A0A9W7SPM4_9PEZI|nr:N amino acid transport system protein [Teratosphaeria destructans]